MDDTFEAPDQIYLQPFNGEDGEATWCEDRINDDDIPYIRADIPPVEIVRLASQLEKALTAIRAVLAEPYGCPFCDSGKLRKPNDPAKGHNDDCPYVLLNQVLEDTKENPMPSTTIQYFEYEHLPLKLQEISKPIYQLAHLMEDTLPDGPEKSAGMRKLLEAKDCFVRAALPPIEEKP